MRTITLLLIVTLMLTGLGYAQQTLKISGQIVDARTKQTLQGATISILNKKTGIFINYAVSNRKGQFQIGSVPEKIPVDVIISFTGYNDTSASFTFDGKVKIVNTGTWALDTANQEMEAVVVTARKPPFVVKNDTLEFNASSFKSLPGDMVQDLLRKLPGMVVDAQGNVTVNGKKVNRIKVDGRDFFTGDLKVALENLPTAIIDKVQVMDTRERGKERNSIINPISENVTLNLTLKQDKKKGSFGSVGAGYGSRDRYAAGAFLNKFRGTQRVSLIGSTSNTGDRVRGAFPMGNEGGGGILKNTSFGGIQLNDDLSPRSKIDFNYYFNSTQRPTETILERINILPDSSFLYNSRSWNESNNVNHSIKNNYDLTIDTFQNVYIETSVNFSNNRNISSRSAISTTTTEGKIINNQENQNNNKTQSLSLNNRVVYNRSSRNRRTDFTATWSLDMQFRNGRRLNQSNDTFYVPSYQINTLNQQGRDKGNGVGNNFSINFSHQLVPKKLTGIFNYTLLQNADAADLDIYNYDSTAGKFSDLDSIYSNHNRNNNWTHLVSASLGYRPTKKLSIELGTGYRIINQNNFLVWKDSTIRVEQRNFSPRLSTRYNLNKTSSLTTNYSVESTAPSTEQLSPVQDNTNSLHIIVGNPYLRSSIMHRVGAGLQYFSRAYKFNLSLDGRGSFTQNQIINDTYYDSSAKQISTYQNVNGARNFSLSASGGSRVKLRAWNLSFIASANIITNRTLSFVDRELNIANNITFAPQVNFNLQYDTKLNIQVTGTLEYHSTKYSLDSVQDIQYQSRKIFGFVRAAPVERLEIFSAINYLFDGQLPANFQRSRTIINCGLGYSLLKRKELRIGLTVNDLLNNNISVSRSITSIAIETRQTMTLRRYAMLTINYRFGQFGENRRSKKRFQGDGD